MTGKEYQKLAMRTNDGKAAERLVKSCCDERIDVGEMMNAALGLSGEVGELNDMIKKAVFHGHKIDWFHIEKEIGDVCWYIAMMCDAFGFDMDEVMQMNIDKLKARYPEGFSETASKNRKEGDI